MTPGIFVSGSISSGMCEHYVLLCRSCHFLKIHMMKVRTRLTTIMVVIGMKTLMFGLLMMISPGSLPRGNFEIQGQKSPMSSRQIPV